MSQAIVRPAASSPKPTVSSPLRSAQLISLLVLALTIVASAGGLFLPGLYREPARIALATRGQDLVTLVAMPVFALALSAAGGGSGRALLVWFGLLGYVAYTYTGAAFAFVFNPFFVVYVALFGLSMFNMAILASSLNVEALRVKFDATTPRRPFMFFLALIALVLLPKELAEILPALLTGTIPPIVAEAGTPVWYPHVLDLGIIVPLCVLAAIWLWQQRAWGFVLAAVLLIKAATMGLALVAMEWFAAGPDKPMGEWALIGGVLAAGGLGLTFWLLRHCDD